MPDRRPRRETEAGKYAPKACAACGRTMEYRKSWAHNWDAVKFCSDKCRSQRTDHTDAHLETEILRLLGERGAGKTICPSEAARAVAGEERERWEPLMEQARSAARRLVAQGRIDVVQQGHIVDASTAKGPIRLRLR